jgi:DNA-binding transcriptional ArsR family regulator
MSNDLRSRLLALEAELTAEGDRLRAERRSMRTGLSPHSVPAARATGDAGDSLPLRKDGLATASVSACGPSAGEILKHMLQHLSPTHNPDPRLDAVFHALADGARREMVGRLSRGPATVSALAEPLPMSLSAVVQHLAVLEASGLVKSEKVGRVRTCSLDTSVLTQAEVWINQRRTFWEQSFDRLGAYLADTKPEDEA